MNERCPFVSEERCQDVPAYQQAGSDLAVTQRSSPDVLDSPYCVSVSCLCTVILVQTVLTASSCKQELVCGSEVLDDNACLRDLDAMA